MAATTRTPYQYSPLLTRKAVRLLKILDEDLGGLPCCSLTAVELDDQPSYHALSYTWGSPGEEATKRGYTAERCEQIVCESFVIPITRNLLDFFTEVRRSHRHLLEVSVWIDAVCIDQDNFDERAVQVEMMQDIYLQAQSVIIWLGREEETTRLASEFVAFIDKADIPQLDLRKDIRQPLSKFLGPVADSEDHWSALKLLLQRTWFSRTWVLQEFCFAVQCSLLCGQYEMSIGSLSKAASLSLHLPTAQPSQFMDLPGNRMMDLHKMKKGIQERSPGNFFNILVHLSMSTATDPKDMVYGILALIKRSVSDASPLQRMEVNYQLSTVEVYTQFTRLLLLEDPRLLLVRNHNPDLQDHADFGLQLPSWVPDYSSRMNFALGDFVFAASNNASKLLPPSSFVLRRHDGLVVNAERIDVVKETVWIFNGEPDPNWIARAIPTILRFLCTIKPVYVDGQPRSQALWLTLASGLLTADIRTLNTTLESLRPLFGLWVGKCLLILARMRSEIPADVIDIYFRSLADLWEPINTLSQSEPDIFLNPGWLVSFPGMSTTGDVVDGLEKFHRMMQEPSNIFRPVLFRTRDGFLGKCSKSVQEGDEVWLIAGMPVPAILRKVEREDCFQKVDIAYVHGVMHGEHVDHVGLQVREIELI